MRLERLDLATVSKAVTTYLDLAYGAGAQPRMPDLSLAADASPNEVLGLFHKEEATSDDGRTAVRYSFRLGNRNYPFMKLVLQEHLVGGEYYFAVDTHDEMDIKPDFPDYEAWMAVRRFNQGLKRKIEGAFADEGLATGATLRRLAAERERVAEPASQRILVIDDEEDLAEAVQRLLECRGYQVDVATDGDRGLALAREHRPDLIVLDYELPEMDGLEVISALREDPDTRSIPVMLSTASRIAMADIRKADGFLAKPFPEELLYEMVQRLLDQGQPQSS